MYIFKVSFSCSDKEIDLWIELLIWKQLVLAQFMGHRFESNKKKCMEEGNFLILVKITCRKEKSLKKGFGT